MQELQIINLNQHSFNDHLLQTQHCVDCFEGTEKKTMKVAFDVAHSLIQERKKIKACSIPGAVILISKTYHVKMFYISIKGMRRCKKQE